MKRRVAVRRVRACLLARPTSPGIWSGEGLESARVGYRGGEPRPEYGSGEVDIRGVVCVLGWCSWCSNAP